MSQDQPADADARATSESSPTAADGPTPGRAFGRTDFLIAAVGLVALLILALVLMS